MTTAAAPQSGEEFFQRVQIKRRRVRTSLCLNSELLEQWQKVQQELLDLQMQHAKSPRMANGGSAKPTRKILEKTKERDALEDEIERTQAWFEFEAMPADRNQKLKDANPPRRDNQLDLLHGYNRDAVSDAWVRASMIDPVFKDCERDECSHDDCHSWEQFKKYLNPSEWDELRESAQEANGAVVDAPKSPRQSQTRRRLAAGSAAPEPGE